MTWLCFPSWPSSFAQQDHSYLFSFWSKEYFTNLRIILRRTRMIIWIEKDLKQLRLKLELLWNCEPFKLNKIRSNVNTVEITCYIFFNVAFISHITSCCCQNESLWCCVMFTRKQCETSLIAGDIIHCDTLEKYFDLKMNPTLVDHDTLASLLQLYRQCKERGETVTLSLDTRWMVVLIKIINN